jgi:CRP/FNR family cyclic AMP-dependent transcriptional regulator
MRTRAMSVEDALSRVSWIAVCGPEAVAALAADARAVPVTDGHAVALRWRPIEHMVVVAGGALEVAMTSPEGKRHVTGLLGPWEVFGLIPVLDGLPSIHDATARGPTDLVLLPRDSLLAAMLQFPALATQVVRLLCSRARRNYDTLAAQSLMDLSVRVARVLVSELPSSGVAVLRLPQTDLADMLGITRQSLNVQLRRLERAGIVRLGRSRIEVLDRSTLNRLGGLVG